MLFRMRALHPYSETLNPIFTLQISSIRKSAPGDPIKTVRRFTYLLCSERIRQIISAVPYSSPFLFLLPQATHAENPIAETSINAAQSVSLLLSPVSGTIGSIPRVITALL